MDKKQVLEMLEVVQKVLDVAKLLFVSNQKVLGYIAIAESVLKQEWVVQLLVVIASLFDKSEVKTEKFLMALQGQE